jgi:flagellar capping protein FliD
MKLGRSEYETEPVENVVEAIFEMAAAYNRLQDALHIGSAKWAFLGESLRTTINKPVALEAQDGLQISPYEIGIAYSPDKQKNQLGTLTVNGEKLNRAFEERTKDVEVLFTHEITGLLPRICQLLADFKQNSAPFDDAQNIYWETVYPPLVRLNNECRRLQAFWWE